MDRRGNVTQSEHEAMFKSYSECRSMYQVAKDFSRSYNAVVRQSLGGPIRKGKRIYPTWASRLEAIDDDVQEETDTQIKVSKGKLIQWLEVMIYQGASNLMEVSGVKSVRDWLDLLDLLYDLRGEALRQSGGQSTSMFNQLVLNLEGLPSEERDRLVAVARERLSNVGPKRLDDLGTIVGSEVPSSEQPEQTS